MSQDSVLPGTENVLVDGAGRTGRMGFDHSLQLIVDTVPSLVSYIDTDLRYRFVNKRYTEWFARSRETIVGKTILEAFGSKVHEAIRPYVARAMKGEPVQYEISGIYDGKGPEHIRTSYSPDIGPDGVVRGIVVLIEDVTERKRHEQIRRSIERQLQLLIEASATLLDQPEISNVLGKILQVSRRFIEADAYAVWRKGQDGTWAMAAHEGLSADYVASIKETTGQSVLTSNLFVEEDTDNLTFAKIRSESYKREGIRALIGAPVRIHDQIAATVVFYYRKPHKFTELEKQVAMALGNLAGSAIGTAELYDSEKQLRRLAESGERRARFLGTAGELLSSSLDYESTLTAVVELSVPTFADWASIDIVDEHGEIRRVAVKHQNAEMIALAHEYAHLFPPLETDASRVALRTQKSILVTEISDDLIRQNARSAEHADFLLRLGLRSVIIVPLVNNGSSFGVLNFVLSESGRRYHESDLVVAEELARRAAIAVNNARLFAESKSAQAALKRSNTELRQANEDLNQFAYSASHDLQEPLRMITIYGQLLQRRYRAVLDEQGEEYLEFITEGARRMEMLLRDLLTYMEAVTLPESEIAPIDANRVVEEVLDGLSAAIEESKAEITCDRLPSLRVQSIHLHQLFQNLLANAIKYRTDRPPRIHIKADRSGSDWEICVIDNGIGIPKAYHQHVFGLFKRLHNKTKYPGTGIGLAICSKIVQRYGGKIWVESEEGRGATFCITLPAADAAE